jgi:pilus assembly protein Flp/PilA
VFEGGITPRHGPTGNRRRSLCSIDLWGIVMTNFLRSFVRDESGAAAAEYALILAIVGAGIAVAAATLGTAISSAMTDVAALI